MTVVTFVSYDGEKHEAPIEEGCSLMQVATNNAIPGIDGDCGGEAACGTCHVIVDSADFARLPPPSEDEEDMLDLAQNATRTSRLSCQIRLVDALDGLTIRIPG